MNEEIQKSYIHIKFIGAAKGEVRPEVSVMEVSGDPVTTDMSDNAMARAQELHTDAQAFAAAQRVNGAEVPAPDAR